MMSMFLQAGYNASSFNLNLSNWDTSNVTNMESMFDGAFYYAATDSSATTNIDNIIATKSSNSNVVKGSLIN